jgi:hypothetical protein
MDLPEILKASRNKRLSKSKRCVQCAIIVYLHKMFTFDCSELLTTSLMERLLVVRRVQDETRRRHFRL